MEKKVFGKTLRGQEVTLYTLENKNGMKLKVMDFGATMVSLFAKDRDGAFRDVILGYDDPAEYERHCHGFFYGLHGHAVLLRQFCGAACGKRRRVL